MGTRIGRSVNLQGIEVEKRRFVTSYLEGLESVERDFARFLANAGEEEVHDARTATRRAEACLTLLPKELRGERGCKKLKRAYRKVMEETARVRDIDILRVKLAETAAGKELAKMAAKARGKAVVAARRAIVSAKEVRGPEVRPTDIRRGSLQRRFGKATRGLASDVTKRVSRVVDDPSNVRDLHRLRVDLKRLRYMIEAVTAGSSARLADLEAAQDALGSIHDWDVSVEYVQRVRPGSEVISAWNAQRDREFRRFLRAFCVEDKPRKRVLASRRGPEGPASGKAGSILPAQ